MQTFFIGITILLAIIFSIKLYIYICDRQWQDVDILTKRIEIDNTKSEFYKRNGFHEYDTMHDVTVKNCICICQYNTLTKKYRIILKGEYVDTDLYLEMLQRKKVLETKMLTTS